MKILLLGDTHASQHALKGAINFAKEQGLDLIFQVGDFGYWPRDPAGAQFISIARESEVPVYWLPGNHEDWDRYEEELAAGGYDDDGFVLRGSMHISPKVHTWTWDGLKFGVLGGAYSVDRSMRTLGTSYFEQETPTLEEAEELGSRGRLDILLTHEAPINLANANNWGPLPRAWKVDWELSNQSQGSIWKAVNWTNPDLLVHGHWHIKIGYHIPDSDTWCQGIDQASGTSFYVSAMVLDTEAKALYGIERYLNEGDPIWRLR